MADTIYTKTGHALAVERFRYPGMAQCENCDDLHPDSTRERCRVHVEQTGHTVRFLIEDVTTYCPAIRPASRRAGTGRETTEENDG